MVEQKNKVDAAKSYLARGWSILPLHPCSNLLWHNIDPEVALELLLAWNRLRYRPPLEDAEVAEVVASITKLHDSRNASDEE